MNFLFLEMLSFRVCVIAVIVTSLNCQYLYESDDTPSVIGRNAHSVEACVPVPLGGIDWIISQWNPNYGWRADTHRAIIALAVNKWTKISDEQIRQMELQLDVEITKNLLRNNSQPMHPNDLALHIHALIATKRNPHDFYGIDLVSKLLKIVDTSSYEAHPSLLLALCNSNAANLHHLHFAKSILSRHLSSKSKIDSLALALNAYECMKTLDYEVDDTLIQEAQKALLSYKQGDGSFGNVYTSCLIVQALAASGLKWNKEEAFSYLQNQATVNVNMVSTYLIQLALNSGEYPFIKDLHPEITIKPVPVKSEEGYFLQYSIRVGKRPDVYFTVAIKVPRNSSIFDVMQLTEKHDSKFRFSYYNDKNELPKVYSISGVPNDAEENLYWRLCLQTAINHDRHTSTLKTVKESPAAYIPQAEDHIIYWYRDTDCEQFF